METAREVNELLDPPNFSTLHSLPSHNIVLNFFIKIVFFFFFLLFSNTKHVQTSSATFFSSYAFFLIQFLLASREIVFYGSASIWCKNYVKCSRFRCVFAYIMTIEMWNECVGTICAVEGKEVVALRAQRVNKIQLLFHTFFLTMYCIWNKLGVFFIILCDETLF